MTAMNNFLYGLLEQAGFTADDNLDMLHDDLEQALVDRLNAKIMEHIPQDKREEASELLIQDDTEKRETFVQHYIPAYDEFLTSVCDEFAKEYLASIDDETEEL